MTKIGIIICARYAACGGGKCFRALQERRGAFSRYPASEEVVVAGYATCGGCPGGNVEQAPAEFLRNGCEVVHLATGLVVGYPPCPYLEDFRALIASKWGLPVVVGTHPIPMSYMAQHSKLGTWSDPAKRESIAGLLQEPDAVKLAYN